MNKTLEKINTNEIGKFSAFNLASLLTSYPDEYFKKDLKRIIRNKDLLSFCEKNTSSWNLLKKELNNILKNKTNLDDICSDYIDIFDRAKSENSLYETEYGRERVMSKPNELADLAGFYRAFGLSNDSNDIISEMVDHVSVELEFYSYMILKENYLESEMDFDGKEIVYEGKKKFLEDHLGRFVESISKRPGVSENTYYSLVFNWVSELVNKECIELNIKPLKVDWLSSQVEPESVECMLAGCGLKKDS
ncbi:MAG: molecular chaperone TorD family protein [Candidatus Sericytochromatia bacterium]